MGVLKVFDGSVFQDVPIVSDHGALTGLGDDDHSQYLLIDGSRAMSGALDMGTNLINNVVDPVSNQDAATKKYVDDQNLWETVADGVALKVSDEILQDRNIRMQSTSAVVFRHSTLDQSNSGAINSSSGGKIKINADTDLIFSIALADEIVLTANTLTFNNGAIDTGLGWATSGQLDFTVGGAIEASLTATDLNLKGNTLHGDSVSGGDLTLKSTSDFTPGKIIFKSDTRQNDSIDSFYGTADDASISYDDTNLIINPRLVGSGAVVIGAAANVPIINNDFSCRVINSTDQTLTNNTDTVVAFDGEDYDTDGMHDNSTNNTRITIKTAGRYLITVRIGWVFNGTGTRLERVRINGSSTNLAIQNRHQGQDHTGITFSGFRELAVDDFLELHVFQNSGGDLNWRQDANSKNGSMSVVRMVGS